MTRLKKQAEMEVMRPCIICGEETDNPENMCMSCQEEVNVWSTHRYHEYCKQVRKDLKDDGKTTDSDVFEVAKNIVNSNHELREFIEQTYGPCDPAERLANDI